MKVLRAIGGFFAKIGRWIANTAWVQPLLIVGGIFAVIFSIPYIKKAIENASESSTSEEYEFYEGHALGLEEGKNGEAPEADVLLGYLEEGAHDKIKAQFGSKFLLSFVQENCPDCKLCAAGYQYIEEKDNKFPVDGFKLYTILVDKMDEDEEEYLAQPILEEHNDLFDHLASIYAETNDYALYTNVPDQRSGMQKKIESLPQATVKGGEGIETPITLMYDYKVAVAKKDSADYRCNYNGISAIYFNYIDLITGDVNDYTKARLISDCWKYEGVFDPDYLEKK